VSYKVYARHGGAAGASQDDITARVPAIGASNQPLIEMGMGCQTGSATVGSFIVPDPVGNLDASLYFTPHQQITWTEDASGDELWLAQGRINGWRIGRGDSKGAAHVEWVVSVDDANVDLRGAAFNVDWVRPAETGVARLLALQAYALNGTSSTRPNSGGVISYRPSTTITISTTHLAPNANTTIMPAKTYQKDTQPLDVVTDCAETEGKDFGVVIHHTGGTSHLCLWYSIPTDHSTYLSTCKISDDVDDWDPEDPTAPVFEPIYDQGDAQTVDGNSNLSGLVSRYGPDDAVLVSLNATLGDDNEYWVDAIQDGSSVTLTQATAKAATVIAARSPYQETDSVSIDVLPEQHHLIAAGMSIQVKAAPINTANTSTVGSYVYRRIVTLQWRPRPDGLYHGILQLNRPNRRPGSGGPLAAAKHVPTPNGCFDSFSRSMFPGAWGVGEWGIPWELVLTTGMGAGDPELAKNAFSVDGNYGVYDLHQVMGAPIDTSVDASASHAWPLPSQVQFSGQIRDHGAYSQLRDYLWLFCDTPVDASGAFTEMYLWTFGGDYSLIYYASPGNPDPDKATWSAWLCTDLSTRFAVYDPGGFFGPTTPGPDCQFVNSWTVAMSTTSDVTCPGAPTDPVVIDESLLEDSPVSNWGGSISITASSVSFRAWGDVDDSPTLTIVDTPSAPTVLNFSPTTGGLHMEVAVDIVESNCSSRAVAPWVEDDLGLGDGATTVYTTAGPYQATSLRVWLDGLEQTAAIAETDPTAGTFTFSFTPQSTEHILVWYQQ